MDDLVLVKIFDNRVEAEIAKGYLESNGIEAIIQSDDVGGMIPSLESSTGGILLLVRKSAQEAAVLLLKTRFVA